MVKINKIQEGIKIDITHNQYNFWWKNEKVRFLSHSLSFQKV